jgi:hypothetical protein
VPDNKINIASFLGNAGSPHFNHNNLAIRWGGHKSLFTEGWVGVPGTFLRLYSYLRPYPLTVGEAMFVLELMVYKWSPNPPFPGYKLLSHRMGVTEKMVSCYAASLEEKGYLLRRPRIGGNNTFDLNPLFAALTAALKEEKKFLHAA